MTPRCLTTWIALATAPVVLGAVGRQSPTFTSAARTVAVYATVTDRDHHLVTDLTREAFEVRDNGRRVDLTVFSADPAPITIAILLDASGSMTDKIPRVIAGTEQLIDRLLPADAGRIGVFGDHTLLSPSFTTNHQDLLRFLHTKVRAGGETPLWNAVDLAMVYLKDVPGRRVVLVFTDGYDTTTLSHGYDAVSRRADAEEVMVYAIGCWDGPGTDDDRPDGNLRKIADRTGGGYTELTWDPRQDLGETFARVADELHHQYVLGFTPATDGKVHDIEVRVVGRSGVTVRARRNYVATP